MIKIHFICHGNICRSPCAEIVMKDLVSKTGLANDFEIASAATSTEELGNPVYPPMRRLLDSKGYNTDGHYARQMTRSDYDYYDYIICMDANNIRNMRYICDDTDGKINMLLEYAGLNRDVADPWYTRNFNEAYNDILLGCTALLRQLT